MATSKEKKKLIQAMYDEVQVKKANLLAAETPHYKTNGLFKQDQRSAAVDIKVLRSTEEIEDIAMFLSSRSDLRNKVRKELGLSELPLVHQSVSITDWMYDLKIRVTQIEKTKIAADIAAMETELKRLSPEIEEDESLKALKSKIAGL